MILQELLLVIRKVARGRLLAAIMFMVAGTGASAAAQVLPPQGVDLEKGNVELALDRTSYAAGSPVALAVRLSIEAGWHTNSNQPTFNNLIATEVKLDAPPEWEASFEVRYPPGQMKTFGFVSDPISVYEGVVFFHGDITLPSAMDAGTYPLRSSVIYQACDDKICLAPVTVEQTLGLTVGDMGSLANLEFFEAPVLGTTSTLSIPQDSGVGKSFFWFIVIGFIGGLILNAMPCVLPILSLKVFGLVKSAEAGRGAVTWGSLATALGIVLSFLLLAAAAIIARSAGVGVGWGIQFQEPVFVGAMAIVMFLFALNLWGLFEIVLPARVAGVGASGPSEGIAGHLTTGFFATLMATPCSAPFLGTALGFALTQDSATTIVMFTAIGTGMASPYLVLAAFPGMGAILPQPGAWMNTFKGIMGLLLAGTVVWLLFVLSALVSVDRLIVFGLVLVALSIAIWFRRYSHGGLGWRRSANAASVLLTVLGIATVAGQGNGEAPPSTLGVATENRLIAWEPFDQEQAEREAAGGKYVFVDVTADWCLTCKVNERLFLETEEVAKAFKEHGVVAMKADWTRRDDAIGKFLAEFGRYGIPFYVMYRPGREPHVLSELLSKAAILQLLGD